MENRFVSPDDLSKRVLRLRIKGRHAGLLQELARDVNFVWNYCNELAGKVWAREKRFLSGYDFHPFTKGAGKAGLRLHSQTVQAIGDEYATRRKQARKIKLRWRVSRGSRRSLGWVPFKKAAIRYRNGQLHYCGLPLGLWDSHGLGQYELGAGNFSEDARGRWYVNLTVRIPSPEPSKAQASVGIDLGLKSFAALSSGEVIEANSSTGISSRAWLYHSAHTSAPVRVRCTPELQTAGRTSCINCRAAW